MRNDLLKSSATKADLGVVTVSGSSGLVQVTAPRVMAPFDLLSSYLRQEYRGTVLPTAYQQIVTVLRLHLSSRKKATLLKVIRSSNFLADILKSQYLWAIFLKT